MVRPVEIVDALGKSQVLERMQQIAKSQLETLRQTQKATTEKAAMQRLNAPNPVTQGDALVLHTEEEEREKQRQGRKSGQQGAEQPPGEQEEGGEPPQSHIDITI